MDRALIDTPASYAGPATGLLASRISRDTAIYASAAAVNLSVGLASVAVLTRFLAPAPFGDLAVLLFFSTVLTVLVNAGSLQGTMSWVFGQTGDEEGLDDTPDAPRAADPRRALSTGLVLTVLIGTSAVGLVVVFAADIAQVLIGDEGRAGAVVLAATAGAVAAVWRLSANAVRLQRRPWSFLASTALHAVLGLGFAVPLLIQDVGIEAPLIGLIAGNTVALAFTLVALRRDVRPAFSLGGAAIIMRRGAPLAPVVFSFYLIQLSDVFFASRFLGSAQVGLYRAASRMGGIVTYVTASFHMASGSLLRDPIRLAADRERGRNRVQALYATYFTITTVGVILATGVLADELIRVAAPAYAGAADLIPVAAIAFAGQYWFILIYRTVVFPSKRRWFIRLSALAAAAYVVGSIVLIPALGIYGPACAMIVAWAVGSLGLWAGDRRSPTPASFEYGRIGGAIAIAALCYGAAELSPVSGTGALAVDLACLAAYPGLLVATRIVPRPHLIVAAALWRARVARGDSRRWTESRLSELDPTHVALVDLLVRQRRAVDDVAALTGLEASAVRSELVRALRAATGGIPEGRRGDEALGTFLLDDGPFATRDRHARVMIDAGVDPRETDTLAELVGRLRRDARAKPPPRTA